MKTTQAANRHTVEITLYNSVDRIENAAVTKDDQLCVFFEKDLTNSPQKSHFSLILPLVQIQTNAQYHDVAFNSDGSITFVKTPPRIKRTTYWTLQVPGGTIRTNWTFLKSPKDDLNPVPIGTSPIRRGHDWTKLANLTALNADNFLLLSNAIQTVYLTRTTPIEFVYVDASMNRSFTIITVDPTVVSKTHTDHPAYYALLPLTVPADIATLPLQALALVGILIWWPGHQ